ncbi:aldehyde dehydrogenase family protein [Vibrio sp. 10N.222.51.C12]|uniref:aldehyde dehydrogenase family protein n=1 Tax=unclassified Vibrio TaxID=2614977 RepID=UPI000C8419F6|nr:aldehyde dehydrogenase family protein [Vibrio sp. 10N.286.48.B7]PMH81205.1 aldehyde dehydrogenase EutE [Vibrio sp. 10N.286.48.B7]
MNNHELEDIVRNILSEKLAQIDTSTRSEQVAIFADVTDAVIAAKVAFEYYSIAPLKTRRAIIDSIRKEIKPLIPKLATDAVAETSMGKVEDKVIKNQAALFNTPGVEDLSTTALTGDDGMVLYEYSPYGVIGSITPSTNPTETLINNAISMLAAGNTVYFSPHPGAKALSVWLIEKLEEVAFKASGIRNLIVSVKEPSFKATQEMMEHPEIALLAVTGGPGIVNAAMKTGKKVIGAGAGNPPCLVDETAEIVHAAKSIVAGASLDNNIPCIAEKALVVVDSVANLLIQQMQVYGAHFISCPLQIKKLRETCFHGHTVNKNLVGRSPNTILAAAGLDCPENEPKLLILEADLDDVFVLEEQLMPVLPIVRATDFDTALKYALKIEGGLHHTAIMHSQNVSRLNKVAQRIQTSIFVKNGPSFAGIGVGAESFTTFTIATPTGEGTTSARSFSRSRRCVLQNGFSIR